MKDIKFRYVWRRIKDGHIWLEIVPIECVEGKGDKPFVSWFDNALWELVGRDLFSGKLDNRGKEIYENDIMQKLDKNAWESGEAERMLVTWDENYARFGMDFFTVYGGEGSTCLYEHFSEKVKDGAEVIGNIHLDRHLLP